MISLKNLLEEMKIFLKESTPDEDVKWFFHVDPDLPDYDSKYKMPNPEEPYGKVNMHYWLSPSGHFYEADRYHWKWARAHIVGDAGDAVERMIKNGWIRVNTDVEGGISREIYIQGKLNNKQKSALEDFAHEEEMPVLDDSGRISINSTKEFYDRQQNIAEIKIPEKLRKSLGLCPKCGKALTTKGIGIWECKCGYNGPNKSLNETGKDVGGWHYWWLDPNLKFHPVEHEGHSEFAWDYLTHEKHMQPDEIKGGDVYYIMYGLGWVRVGLARYMEKWILTFNYEPGKYPTNRQIKALKDLAIEKGADELRDIVKRQWMYIDENIEYPLAKGEDQQSHAGDVNWKGKIVYMQPDKFLKLAAPLRDNQYNQDVLDDIEDKIKRNHPIDPPVLYINMSIKKVEGHEGRHRATVAKKLGIEKIPVLIYTGSNYERIPKWTKDQHDMVDKAEFKPEKFYI